MTQTACSVVLDVEAIDGIGDSLTLLLGSEAESLAHNELRAGWENWDSENIRQGLDRIRRIADRIDALRKAADRGEAFTLEGSEDELRELLHRAYISASEGCSGMATRGDERQHQRQAVAIGGALDEIGWPTDDPAAP